MNIFSLINNAIDNGKQIELVCYGMTKKVSTPDETSSQWWFPRSLNRKDFVFALKWNLAIQYHRYHCYSLETCEILFATTDASTKRSKREKNLFEPRLHIPSYVYMIEIQLCTYTFENIRNAAYY